MADTGAAAAQTYRERMRAKAERLGGGVDATNVDASDFSPAEKLYAGVKTGMRPVSRQARADGGAVSGSPAAATPGRAGRKSGGGLGESYVNRNQKTADEDREGHYPNGGMRKGGRAGRAEGGYISQASGPSETRALKSKTASSDLDKDVRPAAEDGRSGRARGGRSGRADGGPLSTPLAAGMGGQGRMNFNFSPGRSTAFADGGRAKAHERYGHGPSCNCASCGGRQGKAGGGLSGLGEFGGLIPMAIGALSGGDDDDKKPAYAPGAPKQSGGGVGQPSARHPMPKSGSRANTLAEAKARADGGEVAEGAIRQHKLEHKALGKAKGGSTYGTSTPLRLISKHGEGARTAKVYKDPDWGEYRVKHYQDGVHQPKADAHTDDKDDAVGMANQWASPPAAKAKGGGLPGQKDGESAQDYGKRMLKEAKDEHDEKMGRQLGFGSMGSRLSDDVESDNLPPNSIFRKFKKADGGEAKGRARGGRSGKGKTNINIIIGTGGHHPPEGGTPGGLPPNLALKPPPAAPMPMPGGPPPPGPAAPMPMPIPVPMGGGAPGGMPPPPRARGGRAPHAGAGSGLGRLEKIKDYGARSHEGEGLRK